MSKKISVTISNELYDILCKESHFNWSISISALIRDILEDKYRDRLLDDGSLFPCTLKTKQEYFSHHLKMVILFNIITNKDVDSKNLFVKIKKDALMAQYEISEKEASRFFTTTSTSDFYNQGSYNWYNEIEFIRISSDDIVYRVSYDYVNVVRQFLENGDLISAVFDNKKNKESRHIVNLPPETISPFFDFLLDWEKNK